MYRISMNVYAKAKAIELSTYTPPKSANDKFKSREQVRQERKKYKVAGISPNPYTHTKKVQFMNRSIVDAENTGYVPEVIEAKEYSNKRTIFITYNKKKVIVQA
jgi:hypothetical protein